MIIGVAFYNTKTDKLVTMLKPNRHHNVIKKINETLKVVPYRKDGWIQGFIDENEKFLNRQEAAKIAFKDGQTKEKTDILFSEDLW